MSKLSLFTADTRRHRRCTGCPMGMIDTTFRSFATPPRRGGPVCAQDVCVQGETIQRRSVHQFELLRVQTPCKIWAIVLSCLGLLKPVFCEISLPKCFSRSNSITSSLLQLPLRHDGGVGASSVAVPRSCSHSSCAATARFGLQAKHLDFLAPRRKVDLQPSRPELHARVGRIGQRPAWPDCWYPFPGF